MSDKDLMRARHMLVIGPRKAETSCGIRVAAYYPQSRQALPAQGGWGEQAENIHVSLSMDDVTCPRCRVCGCPT